MTAAIHAESGEQVEIVSVHPVADLFPRLSGEEFDDLVADIKERGLVVPLLVSADGELMDGRNRQAACEAAGVKPKATTFYGDDAVGMILALNASRRHLTQSQRAVIVAEALTVSSGNTSTVARQASVSKASVSKAAAVIEHAPEMVADVKAGTKPLNDAYAVAKVRKAAQRSREEQERAIAQRLDRLRDAYPDLVDRVEAGEYSLPAAEGEARDRKAAHESALRAGERNLRSVLGFLTARGASVDKLADSYQEVARRVDLAELEQAAAVLNQIARNRKAEA